MTLAGGLGCVAAGGSGRERGALLQQAARRRHEAMQSMDGGDEHASRSAVQRALDSLQAFKGNSAVQREEQLLAELLDLLSTNKLSLARKVMGPLQALGVEL